MLGQGRLAKLACEQARLRGACRQLVLPHRDACAACDRRAHRPARGVVSVFCRMSGESRVVGDGAAPPACRNAIFAVLFAINLLAILGLCFTFLSNPAFNLEAMADTATSAVQNSPLIPSEMISASALTSALALLFSVVFVFVYLLVMKKFSYALVVGLNIVCIVVSAGLGIYAIANASEAEAYTGSSDSYYASIACGGLLIAMALLGALWMWCIRNRIHLTAKMLSQVPQPLHQSAWAWAHERHGRYVYGPRYREAIGSPICVPQVAHVLFLVPGVMTVSFLMAMLVAIWAMVWCPAATQAAPQADTVQRKGHAGTS